MEHTFIFNIHDIIWRLGNFKFKITVLGTATCFDRGAHPLANQLLKTVTACTKCLASQSPRVMLFIIYKIKLKHFLQLFKIFICKKTQQGHTILINDLIQLYCLRHVLNIQVFIIRKTCKSSFMVFYHAEIIIKLYELSRYRILSWYNVTKSIKYFDLW
jgi:hypothetical protein